MPEQSTAPVSVHPVTRDNWRQMLALSVRPDQQRFVAGYAPVALVILAKAQVGVGGLEWRPYAIYEGVSPAGMFAIASRSPIPDECWVYHFFIDQEAQGRGLGQAGLSALLALVRDEYPSVRRVSLTVHPHNAAARWLYERHGFEASGELLDGEPVLTLTFE